MDTTPPEVTVLSPLSGATVESTVTVDVDATDESGVERIELWIDGALEATDPEAPWSLAWDTKNYDNGTVLLSVKAFDGVGNEASTAPVSMDIANVSRVSIVNTARSTVEVVLNGGQTVRLSSNETLMYSEAGQESLSYEAATARFYPNAARPDPQVLWSGLVDLSSGRDREVMLEVSSSYALFAYEPTDSRSFSRVVAYYDDGTTATINALFQLGGGPIGYLPIDGLAYMEGYGAGIQAFWVPGKDFVVPNVPNQLIVLEYPFLEP
ncbi:MAG: Ig-like domain-containing protein [Bacteroidota bacterium]